jgi:hypothetical protein
VSDKTEPTDARPADVASDPEPDHFPTLPALILVGSDADDIVCVDDTCLPAGTPPGALRRGLA